MTEKELEGAKKLIENKEVKKGSYSYIGDSNITYADIKILLDYIKQLEEENQELKKQLEGRNLVDLGFYDNEPVGFKYDRHINKPVLACRCDNYYYAYPTKIGWIYYRSRYLGERDKEIEDMSFIDWAYAVLKEVE